MLRLIKFELIKTYTRLRTYIGFAAFGLIVPAIIFGLKIAGLKSSEREILELLRSDFIIGGNILNGWFLGLLFMGFLWVHVPIVLTIVSGDLIAGEGNAGTFRFLITRSVSRTKIIIVKFITAMIYTASVVFFIGGLTIGLSLWAFGTGDLLVIKRGIIVIPESELPSLFLIAYLLATLSMFTVSALAFLFSAFTDNSIGPIIATMAVIIGSIIIITMPFSIFQSLRPYLFVNYFDAWQKVFDDPIPWKVIGKYAAILVGFIAGFFSLTWIYFTKKDILS